MLWFGKPGLRSGSCLPLARAWECGRLEGDDGHRHTRQRPCDRQQGLRLLHRAPCLSRPQGSEWGLPKEGKVVIKARGKTKGQESRRTRGGMWPPNLNYLAAGKWEVKSQCHILCTKPSSSGVTLHSPQPDPTSLPCFLPPICLTFCIWQLWSTLQFHLL
jgi:hypothetical protein